MSPCNTLKCESANSHLSACQSTRTQSKYLPRWHGCLINQGLWLCTLLPKDYTQSTRKISENFSWYPKHLGPYSVQICKKRVYNLSLNLALSKRPLKEKYLLHWTCILGHEGKVSWRPRCRGRDRPHSSAPSLGHRHSSIQTWWQRSCCSIRFGTYFVRLRWSSSLPCCLEDKLCITENPNGDLQRVMRYWEFSQKYNRKGILHPETVELRVKDYQQ